jgi:hemolysin III
VIGLFAVSALYHLWPWQATGRRAVRALDHASIFVMIAGTYTPFCVNILSGWLRAAALVAVWLLALLGVVRSAAGLSLPRWTGAGLYLALGWAALLAAPALAQALPQSALVLLATGGLLYTLGAIVYARKWPDPAPHIFGFHEVFHLLVIGASVAFFAVIWVWVLPFGRS